MQEHDPGRCVPDPALARQNEASKRGRAGDARGAADRLRLADAGRE